MLMAPLGRRHQHFKSIKTIRIVGERGETQKVVSKLVRAQQEEDEEEKGENDKGKEMKTAFRRIRNCSPKRQSSVSAI